MDIIIIYIIFFTFILLYLIIDYRNNNIKNMLKMNDLYMKKNMNKNLLMNNTNIENVNKLENVNQFENLNNLENLNELENVNNCKVPTLTTDQCFKSRFFPCNPKNGSYEQCTNNIMPKNFNALCENRAFQLAKPEHKISQNSNYYYGLN